jgi:putative spermidine/putrescine transport system permease protein
MTRARTAAPAEDASAVGPRGWTLPRARVGLLVLPAVVFLAVLYVVSLVRLLLVSLDAPEVSLRLYAAFFTGAYLRILLQTLRVALTVTLLCLLLGYPTAYVLATVQGRARNFLLLFVIVPYLTSFLVRTYAWMVLLGSTGIVNGLLLEAGLIDRPLKLMYNAIGVHVGMVHVLLPLMILPLYSVMRGIDRNLLKAAQNLGGPLRSFVRVFLPLSLPGVRSGCLLVFIVALGFYITPALLGGLGDVMLATLIEAQITHMVQWGFAAAAAFVLLSVSLGGFALVGRVTGAATLIAEGPAHAGPAPSAAAGAPARRQRRLAIDTDLLVPVDRAIAAEPAILSARTRGPQPPAVLRRAGLSAASPRSRRRSCCRR